MGQQTIRFLMRAKHAFFIVALSLHAANGWAEPVGHVPVPTTRQLTGLTDEEATALVVKLEEAQRRLKNGDFQSFELLVGSIASYDMTKSSPREVFLKSRFNEVWMVERMQTNNPLRQPYRLAYAPNGLGEIYWDIEVILGINGDIQRVSMLYVPPAPS